MKLMQPNEIQRLAAAGNALRPDWPARSLATFIERNLAARTYGDIAVALAWIATRTKTDTPRLLLEAGPWWKAAATETAHVQRPPRRDEECDIHVGQWATSCFGCAADQLVGDTTTAPDPRRPDTSRHVAAARAVLAAAKTRTTNQTKETDDGR